jgi:hypothetical protein
VEQQGTLSEALVVSSDPSTPALSFLVFVFFSSLFESFHFFLSLDRVSLLLSVGSVLVVPYEEILIQVELVDISFHQLRVASFSFPHSVGVTHRAASLVIVVSVWNLDLSLVDVSVSVSCVDDDDSSALVICDEFQRILFCLLFGESPVATSHWFSWAYLSTEEERARTGPDRARQERQRQRTGEGEKERER